MNEFNSRAHYVLDIHFNIVPCLQLSPSDTAIIICTKYI